ncbi:DsbA family oxidoreductase [Erythrobacter sp. W53]|uniref:DsbA family oxidoreductase n=1 Tax=Erythrobacter sp. W53 TaxID=3425947 RepID=UPI003D769B52
MTEATSSRTLTIDVWSDVMCPWCLVGWGQLQKGLKLLEGEIDADIRWHAFELNPDMAPEGEDRTAHIARKYGRTVEQSKGVQGQMREAAINAGVSLDYEGATDENGEAPPAMMWNTFAAHKLLTWVGETQGHAKQTELKLAMFAAHFNHRRRIGERNVLLDIAEENGLDRGAAAEVLGGTDYDHKVRAEEQAAWDMNITGVPAMVVEGKFLIPGAQGPEVYADALRRVAEKIPAQTPA